MPNTSDWRPHKATAAAIAKFEEQFGRRMGPITLTRSASLAPPAVISTGSLALDQAMVIGGYPVGFITELWGPEHAGKTSLAMLGVASAQRHFPDKMCGWVDMEQTFDWKWATQLGVDPERLWLVANPHTAEDVADSYRDFVASGLCSLAVLDSVGAMISKDEYERDADEEARVAAVARTVTRLTKQISPMGKANGTSSIIINQVRAAIGNIRGPSTTTGGGWMLKHATAMKVNVRRGASTAHTVRVDGKDVPVSHEIAAKVEKNKLAPYGKVATLWLTNQPTDQWGPVGVDTADEAATFGVRTGAIEVKGAWYTTPDGERHNGRDRVVEHLHSHPELVAQVRATMLAALAGEIKDQPDGDDPHGIGEVM